MPARVLGHELFDVIVDDADLRNKRIRSSENSFCNSTATQLGSCS